ncbi:MAG: hypothetical protein ATN36_06570 [Epulopiscium sp. Nele67-Bin005]|nr:MAG: hypothetical protein ATN36_06570 [Epulopiscium sp. Nele67-Bin005]
MTIEEATAKIKELSTKNEDLLAKNKSLHSELTATKEDKTTLENTINSLKESDKSTELQQKLDELNAKIKADNDERAKIEAENKINEELTTRFKAVLKDKKPVNDLTENALLDKFKALVSDKESVGKSDTDLFDSLTKDKGYFVPNNQNISTPHYQEVGSGNIKTFPKFI